VTLRFLDSHHDNYTKAERAVWASYGSNPQSSLTRCRHGSSRKQNWRTFTHPRISQATATSHREVLIQCLCLRTGTGTNPTSRPASTSVNSETTGKSGLTAAIDQEVQVP
jgi:hypothetical protein